MLYVIEQVWRECIMAVLLKECRTRVFPSLAKDSDECE